MPKRTRQRQEKPKEAPEQRKQPLFVYVVVYSAIAVLVFSLFSAILYIA